MKTPSNRRKYPKRFIPRYMITQEFYQVVRSGHAPPAGEIVRIVGFNRDPTGKILSMTVDAAAPNPES